MADINSLALKVSLDIEGFKEANTEAGKLATSFSKLADSLNQSGQKIVSTFRQISEQLEILKSELQGAEEKLSLFGIEFDISKDPTESLKALSDAIKNFKQSLVSGNEDAIKFIAKLIDGFADLINWMNENIPGLTQVITLITGLTLAFLAAVPVVAAIVAGFTLLAGLFGITGTAVAGFAGTAILAVVAIAAISAAVISLIQNWDALVLAAQVTWEENIVPILETVAGAIAGVLGGIGDIALIIWEGVKEATSAAWEFITEAVSNAVSLLIRIFQGIGEQLSQTWEFVKQTALAAWESIKEIVGNSIVAIIGFFGAVVERLFEVWESAKETASNAWELIKQTVSIGVESIKGLFSGISESLTGVWEGAKEKASEAWEGIKGIVSGAAESIKKFGEDIKNSIIKAFTDAFDKVKEIFSNLLGGLKESWDNFINSFPSLDFFKKGEQPTVPENPLPTPSPESGGGPSAFLNQDIIDLAQGYKNLGDNIDFATGKTKDFNIAVLTEDELLQGSVASLVLNGGMLKNNGTAASDLKTKYEGVKVAINNTSESLDNAGISAENTSEKFEQLENNVGFFEGIKQGFRDFVENVQSNSELMADFFANTLSQMSQSFSDLFFNVITGRFDNLKDLAKQAFEAILRAFLDLVSAIVTKQIVISIAGVFGLGAKGAGAEDVIEAGKSVVDFIGNQFPATPGGDFAPTELDPNTALPVKDSGIGAGIGAGLLGISIGSALGSIINSDLTGLQQGISFGLGAAGAVTGFLIGGPVGAAIGGFIGSLVVPIITALFKKTPRLDIDFDSVKTEVGRRAAEVAEFLDPEFFKNEIAQISVKRGGVGLGQGGDEGIKDIIQEKIEETIDAVQAIINKLPSDLARQLNDALLNTQVDIDTVVKGERLLEFDAKGKEIKKKFEAFINGELSAKFLFAIRDFFTGAFEALGVLPENAQAFVDEQFDAFKNAGSREERAQIGQEFLASFNAFVDAFNIVSGNVNDAIGQTIQSINSLSSKLGFDAVPSIGELKDKLGELLENAELDAETVQMYADLRNAIVQGISDIINSITGLIGKISQLNSTIVGLGGAAVNIIPFLDQAQAKLVDFYTTNIGNLSLGEQETFLDEILGIANAKLAEEQAAFQRAQAARQRAEEAQRARIEKRIDNLNKEKDKINEVFQKRIEALNEELQIAESFAQLTESIRQTLDSILFSPESVLTGVEQVNALQSNITNLQAQLASAVDPEKQLEIAGRLEEAFKTLFDTAGDAFGVNSPEFVAIFDQVTGGLENLADFTGERGRSVEEISAEIERLTAVNEATLKSIDAKIEAAQERLASIGQSTADNTFHASQELTELFEFIRNEYMRILEERFAQLGEVSEFGFQTEVEGLGVIAGFTEENLTVLKGVGEEAAKHTGLLTEIADRLAAVAGFQHGTEGFKNFGRGTLAVLHGLEAVVTKRDIAGIQESLLSQIAGGGISGLADRLAGERDGRDGLSRGGFIAGMRPGGGFIPEFPLSGTRPSPDEPVNHVTEMSVDINVNVNGGSQASLTSLAGEIENMMVRSIRQGRVRKELQEAAVRRVG